MKWWVYVLIPVLVGFGVYKHYVTFDPLNLVVLAALLWTQYISMQRQQQLADLMIQNQKNNLAAHKDVLNKVAEVRSEVRRSSNN